jgi:hypothetical protein
MKDYSLIYIAKWKIKGFEDYAFTVDKRLFNYRTNRFSKKRVKKYSTGYTLNGDFYTLENLKPLTSLIKRQSFDLSDHASVRNLYEYLQKTA